MFRYIILLLIAAAASAWLWVNPGLVEIHVAQLSVAMQLGTFIILVIASVVVLKVIWNILKLPSWLHHRRNVRMDKQINKHISKLCMQLSEGQLLKIAQSKRYQDNLPSQLMKLLANALNGTLTSKQVSASILANEDAEGLIRWIEGLGYLYQGDGEHAQEAFRLALIKCPKHQGILTVLAHSYYQDAQWVLLYDLMQQYKRYIPEDIIALYYDDVAYEHLLTLMDQPESFDQAWRKLPHELKQSIHFMDLKIEHLLQQKLFKKAKTTIERSLDLHWQDEWVRQYMSMPDLEMQKCIKQLLTWLKKEPKNVVLLDALAKAHLEADMVQRAGTYYEAAFSQSGQLSEGLALLAFYQAHQPEKVTQLIPHVTRLI